MMKIFDKQQLVESTCAIVLTIAMVLLIFLTKSVEIKDSKVIVNKYHNIEKESLTVK